jgi:hypothetical protein
VERDDIRVLVDRLSRAHASGGRVISRAAIMAEGNIDAAAVVAWILEHDGQPEAGASAAPGSGLHTRRGGDAVTADGRPPVRYVLPASAFGAVDAPG